MRPREIGAARTRLPYCRRSRSDCPGRRHGSSRCIWNKSRVRVAESADSMFNRPTSQFQFGRKRPDSSDHRRDEHMRTKSIAGSTRELLCCLAYCLPVVFIGLAPEPALSVDFVAEGKVGDAVLSDGIPDETGKWRVK